MAARVEKVVTSGTFALDGGEWEVDNNVWLVGDDDEVLVIDAAHDAGSILAAVGDRRVVAVICTHGHNDHVNAAVEVAAANGRRDRTAPGRPDDVAAGVRRPAPRCRAGRGQLLGGCRNPARRPAHAGSLAGWSLRVRPDLGVLFSGDTLFEGGPGATGRSFSDFSQIIASIRDRLLTLPPDTVVHTGHGDDTVVGREAPHLAEWVARGH